MNPSYLQIGDELLSNALLDTVTVTQELNRHWQLDVRFRQTSDQKPPYESFPNKPCRLFSYAENGAEVTLFEGVVKEAALNHLIYRNYGGWLLALSYSHWMEFAARVACYTTSSLPALATEIAGLTGLSASVQAGGQTATKQYVQWGETDFRFLHRICDDHKAWLRPTAKGVEIFDQFQAGVPLAFREEYGLLSFDVEGELGPPSMDGSHYDPKPMASQTYRQVSQQPSFTGASGPLTNAVLQASQQMPPGYVYDRSRAPSLADYEARLKLESERALGSRVTAHGISRELRVKAGNKIEIGGMIDAAGTYGVTKVIHRWTLHGYENEFWCTPWVHWMEREPPARKKWYGVVPARVVQHSDPENMGRHRIRYFWQEEGEPMLWARMMTPHAGQNRGWFFQPEIGDEVVVAFEDGDPERPLILGCVWNGVDTAPTADFWGGEYADNDVKRIVTKSGNRIQFVDKPGKQAIQLATPRNLKISMYEKANETGRPMLHISNLNGDIMINAPNGRIHFQSKLFSREVGSEEAAAPVSKAVPATPISFTHASVPITDPAVGPGILIGDKKIVKPFQFPDKNLDGVLLIPGGPGVPCVTVTAKKNPGDRVTHEEMQNAFARSYQSNSSCCQKARAAGQGNRKIVFVNGIRTNAADQCDTLNKIANQTCAQVIGVHNATEGAMADLMQVRKDRDLIAAANAGKPFQTHDGRNPAVDSLSDVIAESVRSGDNVEVWGHSQGGAVESLALFDANNRLRQTDVSRGVSAVKVTSFASAAPYWVSGPQYEHYVNVKDFVPDNTGLGIDPSTDAQDAGKGAKVIRFEEEPGGNPTFLTDAQLKQKVDERTELIRDEAISGAIALPPSVTEDAFTKYHGVEDYLNAQRVMHKGCSPGSE